MTLSTPSRVLITGAQGFTGKPLRQHLESHGYTVIPTGLEPGQSGIERLDIASIEDCHAFVAKWEPDYVVNLAGISFVEHADAVDFYRANTLGVTNLLQAIEASRRPVRKVILASSANVYGDVGGSMIAESQAHAPANHYAASKMAMEKMAATFFDRVPIIITRPFNYTGIGQSTSFLIPKIVSHFARRESVVELGNTDVKRDFSDVGMVVDVYRRLLDSSSRSTILNICTGFATSLDTIIALMEEIAGYRITVRVNPRFVRPNDIRELTGDPTALIDAIGPLRIVPIRDTLQAMLDSMRA